MHRFASKNVNGNLNNSYKTNITSISKKSVLGTKKAIITTKDIVNQFIYLIPTPLTYQRDCMLKWITYILELIIEKKLTLNSSLFKKLIYIIINTVDTFEIYNNIIHHKYKSAKVYLYYIKRLDMEQIEIIQLHSDFVQELSREWLNTGEIHTFPIENLLDWGFVDEKIYKGIFTNILAEYKIRGSCDQNDGAILEKFTKNLKIKDICHKLYNRETPDLFYKRIFLHYEPNLQDYLKHIQEAENLHRRSDGSFAVLFTLREKDVRVNWEIDVLSVRHQVMEKCKENITSEMIILKSYIRSVKNLATFRRFSLTAKNRFYELWENCKHSI